MKDLQPKIFIAENVRGLIIGKSKGYFKIIFDMFKKCGYRVEAKLVNMKYLGVPQHRQRVIIIGVRNDLKFNPLFPKPFPYTYSIKEAFAKPYKFQNTKEELHIDENSKYSKAYLQIPIGKNSKKYYNLNRLDYNKPAPTILTSQNNHPHPVDYRYLDTNEVKRLCSFPDDFKIHGALSKVTLGFGNCVPPRAVYHIGKTLLPILEKHYEI